VVIANSSDGKTHTFDLTDDEQRARLVAMIKSDQITGLSIHHDGALNSLPAPKRFHEQPTFGFELLGDGDPVAERIFCQADGVRVMLTRSYKSQHVRCDLVRTGRMRYNPGANGRRR
jgi:hypothetical protein